MPPVVIANRVGNVNGGSGGQRVNLYPGILPFTGPAPKPSHLLDGVGDTIWDTFEGTNGTAPDTAKWIRRNASSGTTATLNGSGGMALVTGTLGGYADRIDVVSLMPNASDQHVWCTVVPTTLDEAYFYLALRADPNNLRGDAYVVEISPFGSAVYQRTAFTQTALKTGSSITGLAAGQPVHVDFQIEADRLTLYVWAGANAKPTTPTWTGTDATFATGSAGITMLGGNAAASRTWTVLDWAVAYNGLQIVSPTGIATAEAHGKGGTLLRSPGTLAEWQAMWEAVPLENGWLGGDGVWSFMHPNGTAVIFTFGDTPITSGGNFFPNSSVVTWTNTGLKLASGTGPWVPNDGDGTWYWAGAMCMEGTTLFVFPSKQQTVTGGFTMIGRGLFSYNWSDPSAVPSSPTKIYDFGTEIAWGSAVVTIGGYHYIFGSWKDTGWYGHHLYLARCPVGGLASSPTGWEFWTTAGGGSWSSSSVHLTDRTNLAIVLDANEPGHSLGTSGVENSLSADLDDGEIKLCSKRAGVFGSDVCIWESPDVTGPYRRRVVAQAPYGSPTENDQTYLENAHYDAPRLSNGKLIVSVSRNQAGRSTLDYFTDPDERYWPWWFEASEDGQWADPTGITSAEAFGTATVGPGSVTVSPTGIATGEAVGQPTITQTAAPTSIATAEAFGTPSTTIAANANGIGSAEAFGTATITVTASPAAIGSAEAFGTPSVTASGTVATEGIASAEAFGQPAITITAPISGIASAEAFGTATITVSVAAEGITSAESIGAPTVTPGTVSASPAGLDSGEAFGTVTVAPGAVSVQPAGLTSAEAFGTVAVQPGAINVAPAGIATDEALGQPTVVPGAATASPTSVASLEAHGQPHLTITSSPAGVATAEALGQPTVATLTATSPTGVASAEAFGQPAITITVDPDGIGSTEAFGAPTVVPPTATVSPTGIASAESHGEPNLVPGLLISAATIGTAEAHGEPTITTSVTTAPDGVGTGEQVPGPIVTSSYVATAAGITTQEALGQPTIVIGTNPAGVASAEALGQPTVTTLATSSPTGIASAEALGQPTITLTSSPASIDGGEAHGQPTVTPGAATMAPTGIGSLEALGTPLLTVDVRPGGITSGEAHGAVTVQPGAVQPVPAGIASGEAFGTTRITITAPVGGIGTGEALGAPSVRFVIRPGGIASVESVATALWVPLGPPPGGRDVETVAILAPQTARASLDPQGRLTNGLAEQGRIAVALAEQE